MSFARLSGAHDRDATTPRRDASSAFATAIPESVPAVLHRSCEPWPRTAGPRPGVNLGHDLGSVRIRRAELGSYAPHLARQSIHSPASPCHEASGTVMPGSFDFFGTLVHLAIQQHYVTNIDPLAATEYLIPGSGSAGGSGRADIVDSTGGVYEIKPFGRRAEAFQEAEDYVLSAEKVCDNPGVNWHLGTNYRPPAVPIVIGGEIVTSWLAAPGVILYLRRQLPPVPVGVPEEQRERQQARNRTNQSSPVPIPVPVPARSTTELIVEWARSVIASGADASAAAEQFFHEHPELPWVVLVLGVAAILALAADDVTLAGIADDVLIPIIGALMRVAWRFA